MQNEYLPLHATPGVKGRTPPPTPSLAPSTGERDPQAATHIVSALPPTCQGDEMLTWAQPHLAGAATSRFVFKDWPCLGNGCWRILRQNSQRPESESSFLGQAAQGFPQPPHQPPELGQWPRGWCPCLRAGGGRKLPPPPPGPRPYHSHF